RWLAPLNLPLAAEPLQMRQSSRQLLEPQRKRAAATKPRQQPPTGQARLGCSGGRLSLRSSSSASPVNLVSHHHACSHRELCAVAWRELSFRNVFLDACVDRAAPFRIDRRKCNDGPIRNGVSSTVADRIGLDNNVAVGS